MFIDSYTAVVGGTLETLRFVMPPTFVPLAPKANFVPCAFRSLLTCSLLLWGATVSVVQQDSTSGVAATEVYMPHVHSGFGEIHPSDAIQVAEIFAGCRLLSDGCKLYNLRSRAVDAARLQVSSQPRTQVLSD